MASSSQRTLAAEPPSPAMPEDVEKSSAACENRGAPRPGIAASPPPPVYDEAEENFKPKTLKFWAIIVSIFLALFLVAIDRTIISTAVPSITQEFNSMGDIGWYGSAYQLTTAASQLVFGRIYKFYEIKRTFLISVLVFEAGSALSGSAPNSIVFIVGRAISGLGGAGIFSGVMIIMIPMVPLRKRPMFQGIFGSVFGLASVLGPLVGGAFTTAVSWRWCFYMNLPIGAIATVCLILTLHLPKKPSVKVSAWEHFTRLDPLGTFFFVPSVVSLLIALQWGGSKYPWDSWRIVVLFSVFGAGLIAFGVIQVLMPNTATVPVRIIKRRSILAGAIFMFCLAGSMLLVIFFLPMWFQVVQGVSALSSGIYTLPYVISMVIASILSGGITAKIGYYVPAMLLCPSIMAVGQGLMSTFRVVEERGHWIGFQVLSGFGLGLGMQASGLAAQAVLPKPDIPTGIAIMFFAQQLGGAIFTSVGQNLLSNTLASNLENIPGIDPSEITNSGAGDLIKDVPFEFREEVRGIYNYAITRIFLAGMGVALGGVIAALFMEWKNIKKVGPPGGPGGPGGPRGPGGPPPGQPGVAGQPGGGPSGKARESLSDRQDGMPDGARSVGHSRQASFLEVEPVSPFEASMPEKLKFPDPTATVAGLKPDGSAYGACEHCDHCRLSNALTLVPLDPPTAPWETKENNKQRPISLPQPGQYARSPYRMSTAEALNESARLASIARDAVAQLEELTRPFTMYGGWNNPLSQPGTSSSATAANTGPTRWDTLSLHAPSASGQPGYAGPPIPPPRISSRRGSMSTTYNYNQSNFSSDNQYVNYSTGPTVPPPVASAITSNIHSNHSFHYGFAGSSASSYGNNSNRNSTDRAPPSKSMPSLHLDTNAYPSPPYQSSWVAPQSASATVVRTEAPNREGANRNGRKSF